MWFSDKTRLPTPESALPGRDQPVQITGIHYVNGNAIVNGNGVNDNSMLPPMPAGLEEAVFGLGCFWGAERVFWKLPGVYSTAVGYAGGFTPNPTYEEVCSGQTAHTEVVRVYFDPQLISYEELLRVFWASHDPTQGMRQGNDRGSQYRSAIYTTTAAQKILADQICEEVQGRLHAADAGQVTSEICELGDFYYAEEYHQQYLAKNPNGYCGIRGLPCLI
jgi:peptide-methionine (S)-S-oxide reductase